MKVGCALGRASDERDAENPATGLFLNLKNLKNIRSSEINLKNLNNLKNIRSSGIKLKNLKNLKNIRSSEIKLKNLKNIRENRPVAGFSASNSPKPRHFRALVIICIDIAEKIDISEYSCDTLLALRC